MWSSTRFNTWTIVVSYIYYLHTVCKQSLPILFADDRNLFLSGKNLDDMQKLINEELTEIALWLKANKLSLYHKYLIRLLMYGIDINSVLQKINGFFERNRDVHHHNTRQTNNFHLPRIRTDFGKFSFMYQGASIWNEILKSGISMESYYTFSKNLRTALVNDKI